MRKAQGQQSLYPSGARWGIKSKIKTFCMNKKGQ